MANIRIKETAPDTRTFYLEKWPQNPGRLEPRLRGMKLVEALAVNPDAKTIIVHARPLKDGEEATFWVAVFAAIATAIEWIPGQDQATSK